VVGRGLGGPDEALKEPQKEKVEREKEEG